VIEYQALISAFAYSIADDRAYCQCPKGVFGGSIGERDGEMGREGEGERLQQVQVGGASHDLGAAIDAELAVAVLHVFLDRGLRKRPGGDAPPGLPCFCMESCDRG
jgi:hypothetical protein